MPTDLESGPAHLSKPDAGKENNRPGLTGKPEKLSSSPVSSSGHKTPSPEVSPAPLTEVAVKNLVRQQRVNEKQGLIYGFEPHDDVYVGGVGGPTASVPTPQHRRHPTDPNSLAVNGPSPGLGLTGLPPPPQHSRHPTDRTQRPQKSPSPDAGGDAESEGEQNYLSPRMQRWVESYLDSLKDIAFTDDAGTDVAVDSERTEREQLDQKIRFIGRDALRMMVLDSSEELTMTLHELISLDEKMGELDDDNARLELQVGRKQENIDILQVQLSASEDYASALLIEKNEALRKLTEAKTELALIGARNAKLQKQLSAHTGEDVLRDSCELGRTLNMLSTDHLASAHDNDSEDMRSSQSGTTPKARADVPAPASPSSRLVEAASRSVAEAQARLNASNKRIEELEKVAKEREALVAELKGALAKQTPGAGQSAPTAKHSTADAAPAEADAGKRTDRALRRLSTLRQRSSVGGSESSTSDGEERPGAGTREKGDSRTAEVRPARDTERSSPAPGKESARQSRVNNVWRRMYEDSILRVGRLEREVERLKASAATTASPDAKARHASPPEDVAALTQEAQRLRDALASEKERSRRLSASESELLTQVADLARTLREKESAERSQRSQRREERVADFVSAVAHKSSGDVDGGGLQKPTQSNARGGRGNSSSAARHRSDVLKAFEEVKLRAVLSKSGQQTYSTEHNDTPAPAARLDDSHELSYSPTYRRSEQAEVTHSPSPPRHRARSGSLLAPPGHLRKSISDALMNSQSGTHEVHLLSPLCSVHSPPGAPSAGTGFEAFKSSDDDPPLDSSANVFHGPRQSTHGCTSSSGQGLVSASSVGFSLPLQSQTLPSQPQQATPRRSANNAASSGGALPTPVRVPIHAHPSTTNSGATTPRGLRDRSAAVHADAPASAATGSMGYLYNTTGGLATTAASRRGIARGVSQDRAPRRRSSSQTVGVSSGKARSPSVRAGASGATPVVASRRT